MQRDDDKPPVAPGRPSLLSSEQQAEADRLRAQARPDAQPSPITDFTQPPKAGKAGWVAGAVALVALCGTVAVWMASDSTDPALAVVPAPIAAPAAGPAPITVSDKPAEPEPEVSTAAILQDTPAGAQKEESIKDLLAKPSARDAEPAKPEDLNKLLEGAPSEPAVKPAAETEPVVKPAAPPQAARARPAPPKARVAEAKPKPVEKKVERVAAKKPAPAAAPEKEKESAPADSDVTLLAALMAHNQAREASAAAAAAAAASAAEPVKAAPKAVKPAKAAEKQPMAQNVKPKPVKLPAKVLAARTLKQCRALKGEMAEQCKVRLCAGAAKKEAACKDPKLSRAKGKPPARA